VTKRWGSPCRRPRGRSSNSPTFDRGYHVLFTTLEIGLQGSIAFANEHPWAKDVGLVINLDAGGPSGPAYLAETGPESEWLI